MKTVVVEHRLWSTTWDGLERRGGHRREAACVWLGKIDHNVELAHDVVFLDDLPGTRAQALNHRTSREAVDLVLARARASALRIVADIHTHPAEWVGLSPVDRAHPMEYRIGLLALVLPDFAQGPRTVTRVGAHEYLGDGRWKTFETGAIGERLTFVGEASP